MRFSHSVAPAFLLTLLSSTPVSAKEAELKPCTVKSSTTHSLFDLSTLSILKPEDHKKSSKDDRDQSWHARGYDYGSNFTLNICAPVVEDIDTPKGLTSKESRNVSAYYQRGDTIYSLGSMNTQPIFRGRKLVLNYTGGSPCPAQAGHSTLLTDPRKSTNESGKSKGDSKKNKDKDEDDDDDDDDDDDGDKGGSKKPTDTKRRKSTIISFLCDSSPNAPKAALSFVGTTDDCTYMFEARSPAACGGASQANDSGGVGPAGVFGLIVLITVAAYILGGVAYQRTVMHQRGWKQLPNYAFWSGIGNFIKDFFIIAFSSCARWIPGGRGGYNQLPTHNDRSRFSRNEDENRLIDQLDEEWDD